MKKMLRLVKGKGKEKEREPSLSSRGSRISLAVGQSPGFHEDSPKSFGRTPLRLLQSTSALDIGSVSSYGTVTKDKSVTKLHQAALNGDLEKLKKHLKKLDINVLDSRGRTPLHIGSSVGHINILYHLVANGCSINAQDNEGSTALQKAVEGDHIEAVQFLLDKGSETDIPDGNGNTATHTAVRQRNVDSLSVILRKGANPDILNYDGIAPLHLAVNTGNIEIVEVLLRNGALVNITSHQLVTPLMLAVKKGSRGIISALMEYNASVDKRDAEGKTAYDYANSNSKILDFLRSVDRSGDPVTSFPSKPVASSSDYDLGGPVEAERDEHVLGGEDYDEVAGDPQADDLVQHLDGQIPQGSGGSGASSWNDSDPLSAISSNINNNNNVRKTKSVFNLSKFMIGSDNDEAEDMDRRMEDDVDRRMEDNMDRKMEDNVDRRMEDDVDKRIEDDVDRRMEDDLNRRMEDDVDRKMEDDVDRRIEKNIDRPRSGSISLDRSRANSDSCMDGVKKMSAPGPPKPPRIYDSVENIASISDQQVYDIKIEEDENASQFSDRKICIVEDESVESPVWSEDDLGLLSETKDTLPLDGLKTRVEMSESVAGTLGRFNTMHNTEEISRDDHVIREQASEVIEENVDKPDKEDDEGKEFDSRLVSECPNLLEDPEIKDEKTLPSLNPVIQGVSNIENDSRDKTDFEVIKKMSLAKNEEELDADVHFDRQTRRNEIEMETNAADISWTPTKSESVKENINKAKVPVTTNQSDGDDNQNITLSDFTADQKVRKESIKSEKMTLEVGEKDRGMSKDSCDSEDDVDRKEVSVDNATELFNQSDTNIKENIRLYDKLQQPLISPARSSPASSRSSLKSVHKYPESDWYKKNVGAPVRPERRRKRSKLKKRQSTASLQHRRRKSPAQNPEQDRKIKEITSLILQLESSSDALDADDLDFEEDDDESRFVDRLKAVLQAKEKTLDHRNHNQEQAVERLAQTNRMLEERVLQMKKEKDELDLQLTLTSGRLGTIDCLKGSLMDNIDDQKSQILQKSYKISQLEIENATLRIENEWFNENFKAAPEVHDSSGDSAGEESENDELKEDFERKVKEQSGSVANDRLASFDDNENIITELRTVIESKDKFIQIEREKSQEMSNQLSDLRERLCQVEEESNKSVQETEGKLKMSEDIIKNNEHEKTELERQFLELVDKLEVIESENNELKSALLSKHDVEYDLRKIKTDEDTFRENMSILEAQLMEKGKENDELRIRVKETTDENHSKNAAIENFEKLVESKAVEISELTKQLILLDKRCQEKVSVNEMENINKKLEIKEAENDALRKELEEKDIRKSGLEVDEKQKEINDQEEKDKVETEHLKTKVKLLEEEIEKYSEELEVANSKIQEINEKYLDLKEESTQELKAMSAALKQRDDRISELGNQLSVLTADHANEARDQGERNLSSLTFSLEEKSRHLEESQTAYLALSKKYEDTVIVNKQLKENSYKADTALEAATAEHKAELDKLKLKLKRMEDDIDTLTSEKESCVKKWRETELIVGRYKEQSQQEAQMNLVLREENESLKMKIESAESEREKIRSNYIQLHHEHDSLMSRCSDLDSDLEMVKLKNRELENNLKNMNTQLSLTRSYEDSRNEEIEHLIKEVKKKENELRRLDRERMREVQDLRDKVDQQQARLTDINARLGELVLIGGGTQIQGDDQTMKFHTLSSIRKEMDHVTNSLEEETGIDDNIRFLNEQIDQMKRKESKYERILCEHNEFKIALQTCELQLENKEKQLEELEEQYTETETRLNKITRFLEEETVKVNSLEQRLEANRKEKRELEEKVEGVLRGRDDCQEVILQLKQQLKEESARKQKEEKHCEKLRENIFHLENEIQHLKRQHEKENKRLHVVINDLEGELKKENSCLKEHLHISKRLKAELEEEKMVCRKLEAEAETRGRRMEEKEREENRRSEEHRNKISNLNHLLELEKKNRQEAEDRLDKERKNAEKEINIGLKLKDLEFETSSLRKHNHGLENELIKTREKLSNLDDILNENKDLQEAVIKKDLQIEDLENKLSRVRNEEETKFHQTLTRLRTEYEIMAKATVSTKLRKINNYIGEKNRRQEELDKERESVASEIQVDLEERLSNALTELTTLKQKFKKTEEEFVSLRSVYEKREKQLRTEQNLRRQLEAQLDKILNQRIVQQMDLHTNRNSLESPFVSPQHKYRSASNLLFK